MPRELVKVNEDGQAELTAEQRARVEARALELERALPQWLAELGEAWRKALGALVTYQAAAQELRASLEELEQLRTLRDGGDARGLGVVVGEQRT